MQFKKIDELRPGMRLAKPIYNKNGVLLFERDSKINQQGIDNISNFGLIGLFILEPAEPCPPMSPEDIEFERFQTVNVFSLMDEMGKIMSQGKTAKLPQIVANIVKSYGHQETKINFNQNLRSEEDAKYKHALNVAILAALMCNKLNVKVDERLDIVTAALLKGIVPVNMVENIFSSSPNIKRYITQAGTILDAAEAGYMTGEVKLMTGGKILAVASLFDDKTAMKIEETPESEVSAMRYLLDKPAVFEKNVVMALANSINILTTGVCVELNTGKKALVISENSSDMFRPMVLSFERNEMMDLSNRNLYGDIEIKDIMKTMDNRHVVDMSLLNS